MSNGRELFTISQVAKRCGVTERQADYAARRFNVEATTRVGIIRVYDAGGVKQIKTALDQIGGKREMLSA